MNAPKPEVQQPGVNPDIRGHVGAPWGHKETMKKPLASRDSQADKALTLEKSTPQNTSKGTLARELQRVHLHSLSCNRDCELTACVITLNLATNEPKEPLRSSPV